MPQQTCAPTLSRGVYGFVLHITFKSLFVLYVCWALIPEDWFYQIGFPYFPQRYWAVAVPIFCLTFLAAVAFFIYPSLGLLMTPDCTDITTIEDQHTKYLVTSGLEKSFIEKRSNFETYVKSNSIPPKHDIHFTEVSKVLYGK